MSELTVNIKEKKYQDKVVYQNLSFTADKGDFIVITGKSGVGKTTLLNMISGIDQNYLGEIRFKDDLGLRKNFRYKFGYIFQSYGLIDEETVYDNLLVALEFSQVKNKKDQIYKQLKKFNLEDKINSKVYTLSGGEQQRISIIRILLKDAQIILADEPTGNLDLDNTTAIMEILKELTENQKIVIMVTHNQDLHKYANQIIDLNQLAK